MQSAKVGVVTSVLLHCVHYNYNVNVCRSLPGVVSVSYSGSLYAVFMVLLCFVFVDPLYRRLYRENVLLFFEYGCIFYT